jgi:hypothetical protein
MAQLDLDRKDLEPNLPDSFSPASGLALLLNHAEACAFEGLR